MSSRIQLLRGFIAARPDDPFPRYALAQELRNAGDAEGALREFERVMDAFPDYVASYLHAGNTAAALGRIEDARRAYTRGLAACSRVGDTKTLGEIEAALAAL